MATSIDVTSMQGWASIEAELPEDFEALAKEKKVLETQYGESKIETARDLLRLVLLHAGADLPLRQTVAVMAEGGGPAVSHVTLHKKMRLASPFLRALVARLAGGNEASPERWAGYEIMTVDASAFCGPGADTTDARIHLQLRLADLEIVGCSVESVSVGESFKRFSWSAGQLAVGDRGYCNPPGIAHVVSQGADVLVRVNRGTLPMATQQTGKAIHLMDWLRSLRGHGAHERRVTIAVREKGENETTIEGRLIAMRLPAAEAEKARARVRRELGGKASTLDFEAAQYVVLFTTVPQSRMSAATCLALYRLRWQVEISHSSCTSCHRALIPFFDDVHPRRLEEAA